MKNQPEQSPEILAAVEALKQARKKVFTATELHDQDLDRLIASDSHKRPLTFADMMYGLAVIDRIVGNFYAQLSDLLSKPHEQRRRSDFYSPLQEIEYNFDIRQKLYGLYFAHFDVNKPGNPEFDITCGPNFEAVREAEKELRIAEKRLEELRGK